ncbi:flagellar basal body P-ring protein FlgI [Polaromonas sp. A23]|uniref:flagellar basal body P-ring protein FlgI n=1 Tax=Polaromonas sp. A23 TaxID=1944133 RepID=UPI000987ACDA|nr:flagellar basal body P-ring protein FlgI [Polaromonas sp. A23]OOG44446.1 flagellar biosynthesis protein FlgI [Polaromonas sp. A23]
MKAVLFFVLFMLEVCVALPAHAVGEYLRIKDIARLQEWRSNQLVGYGLVSGLAGTGDSMRNPATRQSLANMLKQFDLTVPVDQIQSRNVAIVMIMADLPAFAQKGDRVDVTVTSAGDARSLVGASLMMAPLKGADNKVHALAQGAVSVGGYKYDANGNVLQKNHPTVGMIPAGAIIEVPVNTSMLDAPTSVRLKLSEPDYTTASRVARAINSAFARPIAIARDAGMVEVAVDEGESQRFVEFMTKLENVMIEPDSRARVVVNERTGTVVAGAGIKLSRVTIAHGDIKLSIVTENQVSQPTFIGRAGSGVHTVVVPSSRIEVAEANQSITQSGTSVGDLVQALNKVKVSTRDIIAILQSIKAAGALHADLIIQ